jgi:hypothetical protein
MSNGDAPPAGEIADAGLEGEYAGFAPRLRALMRSPAANPSFRALACQVLVAAGDLDGLAQLAAWADQPDTAPWAVAPGEIPAFPLVDPAILTDLGDDLRDAVGGMVEALREGRLAFPAQVIGLLESLQQVDDAAAAAAGAELADLFGDDQRSLRSLRDVLASAPGAQARAVAERLRGRVRIPSVAEEAGEREGAAGREDGADPGA